MGTSPLGSQRILATSPLRTVSFRNLFVNLTGTTYIKKINYQILKSILSSTLNEEL